MSNSQDISKIDDLVAESVEVTLVSSIPFSNDVMVNLRFSDRAKARELLAILLELRRTHK